MLRFNIRYFICAAILFFIEVFIAWFIHDDIVRPYIGDLLVVILIYCFLRAFLTFSVWTIAIATLLFSYAIETLQYFNIVEKLGLQHSKIARVIIGTSFSWTDILAYTCGVALVLLAEKPGLKRIRPYT